MVLSVLSNQWRLVGYVRILVNWVVCGHWCQLLNEYFQQTKSVDLSELRCVDISELCYLWSLVGFSGDNGVGECTRSIHC